MDSNLFEGLSIKNKQAAAEKAAHRQQQEPLQADRVETSEPVKPFQLKVGEAQRRNPEAMREKARRRAAEEMQEMPELLEVLEIYHVVANAHEIKQRRLTITTPKGNQYTLTGEF